MPAKITILSLYYKRRLVHKAAIVKKEQSIVRRLSGPIRWISQQSKGI